MNLCPICDTNDLRHKFYVLSDWQELLAYCQLKNHLCFMVSSRADSS